MIKTQCLNLNLTPVLLFGFELCTHHNDPLQIKNLWVSWDNCGLVFLLLLFFFLLVVYLLSLTKPSVCLFNSFQLYSTWSVGFFFSSIKIPKKIDRCFGYVWNISQFSSYLLDYLVFFVLYYCTLLVLGTIFYFMWFLSSINTNRTFSMVLNWMFCF